MEAVLLPDDLLLFMAVAGRLYDNVAPFRGV